MKKKESAPKPSLFGIGKNNPFLAVNKTFPLWRISEIDWP
jgi:hypothetical protein